MISRFVNPHAVPERTKSVSRAAMYANDSDERCTKPDLSLLDQFNAIVENTLPLTNPESILKKRRKLEVEQERKEEKRDTDALTLFRLISSGPPVLVSLKPKEALIKVKEPEIEDSETQAKERRERALAVAVDADWVFQESLKSCRHAFDRSPILHLNLPIPLTSSPNLVILSHNKHIRKTRPPVQRKLGYPYDAFAKPEPLESTARFGPVIDLNQTLGDLTKEPRQRRRTKNIKKIEHKFWKPDPNIKGKCSGYAMGFGMGRRR